MNLRNTRIPAILAAAALAWACGGGSGEEAEAAAESGDGTAETEGGDTGAEAGTDTATDPATDAATDPATDTTTDPATDTATDPAPDAGAGAGSDPATDPAGGADAAAAWRTQVAAGRRSYNRICGTCHGAGGVEGDLGPEIRNERMSVSAMRNQIRNGSGRMRPIPPNRLPDSQMDGLMAYLSTFGAVRGVQRP